MDNGIWVALHFDFSGFAVFPADQELEARRYAGEQNMSVHFVEFGKDVRRQVLGR